jgi:hypothetical protein
MPYQPTYTTYRPSPQTYTTYRPSPQPTYRPRPPPPPKQIVRPSPPPKMIVPKTVRPSPPPKKIVPKTVRPSPPPKKIVPKTVRPSPPPKQPQPMRTQTRRPFLPRLQGLARRLVGKRSEVLITDGEKKKGRSEFQGLEVRAQRKLSHLDPAALRKMKKWGTSAHDVKGRKLELHHHKQNPAGPIIEIPDKYHKTDKPNQHPKVSKKEPGLTKQERADFNNWKRRYWRHRATQELQTRGLE